MKQRPASPSRTGTSPEAGHHFGAEQNQILQLRLAGIGANEHGKIAGDNNLFVTGWIKRGPTGIIGTNIVDAKDTVNSAMEFISSEGSWPALEGRAGLADHLQNQHVKAIDWPQFLRVEAAESDSARLRSDVQPREKFLSVKEMLDAAS